MKYKIPGSILHTLHIAAGLNVMIFSQAVKGDEQPPLPPDCLSYCEAKYKSIKQNFIFTYLPASHVKLNLKIN